MKHHRRRLALASILGIFSLPIALGVVAAEAGAAPAAPTPTPAPGAAPAAPAAATPPATPAAPAATPSLRAMVSAGIAAVRGGTAPAAALATLTTERDTARQERDTARTDLATAQTALTSAQAQVSAFCGILGISAADLAGKDKAALASLVDTRIKAAISEEISQLGFPAAALPAASTTAGATADNVADLRTQLAAETDPAKKGQLVAQIRKLEATAKKSAG